MLQSRISGFTPALRWLARVCVRAKPIGRVNPFGKVVFGKVVQIGKVVLVRWSDLVFGIWYLVRWYFADLKYFSKIQKQD